jgi:dTDP-4-amino-4,6-dideoxygalactose transaminase
MKRMEDTLAIHGGTPTVREELKRRWPDIRAEDKAAVLAVLDRGELTGITGIEATSLEREWADRLGVAHAVLFNTGTAAIHAALYAVGVEAGDEVITTAFTFSGTFQAVLHQGAIPVFVDIDPRTYNLDPAQIEARITPRTKAILPVHIHGTPCDMDAIMDIARRHSLAVVEDAAQAHLATYRGRFTGTIGDAGAFSVQATKNFSGIEGGFVVSNDADVAAAARRIRTYGEDIADGSDLGGWYFRPYTVFSVGWNYRSNELSAAFARSQLRRLDEYTAIAQRNGRFLNAALAEIPGLRPPVEPDGCTSVFHKYRVRFDTEALGVDVPAVEFRGQLMAALRAEGVDAVLWHTQPVTSFPIHQTHAGFGRGYPWNLAPGAGKVDPDEYPQANALLDSSLIVCDEIHPIMIQPQELMEAYAEAFRKVLREPRALVADVAESAYVRS